MVSYRQTLEGEFGFVVGFAPDEFSPSLLLPGIPRYFFYNPAKKDVGRGRRLPKKDWGQSPIRAQSRLAGARPGQEQVGREKGVQTLARNSPEAFAPAFPGWLLGRRRWPCQAAYKAETGVPPRARLHVSPEWRKTLSAGESRWRNTGRQGKVV